MIKLLFLLLPFSFAHAAPTPAESEKCQRCVRMNLYIATAKALKASLVNQKQLDKEDDLVTDASAVIYDLLRKRELKEDTILVLMELIAKIVPFANTGIIGDDNSVRFIRLWNAKDSFFPKAVDQLIAEGRITETEKTEMLIELGVIKQSAPRRRAPQSTKTVKPLKK